MENSCVWKKHDETTNVCINCGFELPSKFGMTTKRLCRQTTVPKSLVELIDNCPHRGDPTGQKVGCGCLSMPKQDVFFCAVHGEAIRHKITKSEWDGIACIECEKPREKLSSS